MTTPNEKGRGFESEVGRILELPSTISKGLVEIHHHPRVTLYDGQEVVPDFEIVFDLGFERSSYLIECQNRKRSTPQIAQKIKYIKGLSKRNRFILAYRERIPSATQSALTADGVLVFSYTDLAVHIIRLCRLMLVLRMIEGGYQA